MFGGGGGARLSHVGRAAGAAALRWRRGARRAAQVGAPRRAGGEGMAPSGRLLGGDGVGGGGAWFVVVRRKGAALPWWCVLGSVVRGSGVWLGFECCLFRVF